MSSSSIESLSKSKGILYIAYFLGTVPVGLGLNAILRPKVAITLFDLNYPNGDTDQKKTVDTLMMVYGARNLFMASSILISAYLGTRQALGCIFISTGALAFMDGLAARIKGRGGEWNHWAWSPVLSGFGAIVLGVLD